MAANRVVFILTVLCFSTALCAETNRTETSRARSCDVRNDLQSIDAKAYHAPVVFTGTVRSRGSPRGSSGMYEVTVEVMRVHKGSLGGGRSLRLRYRLPPVGKTSTSTRRRRRGCIAEARLTTGGRYVLFVKTAPVGGVRNYTAITAPEPHSRQAMRKVARVVCKNCVRPPRVARMKSVTVQPRKRIRLHCKVRGRPQPAVSWLKNGKLLRSSRRVRIKNKRRKRRVSSTLIIRRVRPDDAGTYQCRAKNLAGTRSKQARVTVSRKAPARRPNLPGRKKPRPLPVPIQVEPCKIQSYCLNGGRCMSYPAMGELACECAEGFQGKRCGKKAVYSIKHQGIVLRTESVADSWVRSPWQRTKSRSRRRHRPKKQ